MRKKAVKEDVLTLARERISHIFDRFDHVAVSFSGGKDSTICLHLTLEEAQKRGRVPLDVVFFDEEAQCPETIEYMDRVSRMKDVALRWYCLPVKHRNACSRRTPYWNPWAPEDQAKWCRPLPAQALTTLAGFNRETIPDCTRFLFSPDQGQVGFILGIRTDESLRRYRSVTWRVYENYISHVADCPFVYLAKPVYDWKVADVWTAPHKFGWDYNRAYDVMTHAGMSRHVQRVCPPYGEEPLQNLWMYGICWPDLWEAMANRVPGARTAARYSRSPLYAFSCIAGKAEGSTWPHLITLALQKWPEDLAPFVADRISRLIKQHNSETNGEPIPDDPHPVTGVGWNFLYLIAVRGDLKGRKSRVLKSYADPREAVED